MAHPVHSFKSEERSRKMKKGREGGKKEIYGLRASCFQAFMQGRPTDSLTQTHTYTGEKNNFDIISPLHPSLPSSVTVLDLLGSLLLLLLFILSLCQIGWAAGRWTVVR